MSLKNETATDRINELERVNKVLQQKVLELYTLHNISKTLGSTLRLDEVFSLTVDLVHHSLQVDIYSLMLLHKEKNTLITEVYSGPGGISKREYPLGEPVFGNIALTKRPRLIRDINQDREFIERSGWELNTGSYLGLPLIGSSSNVIGVLSVYKKKPESFLESDLGFYSSIAEHVAIAIENARLYQEIRELSHRDDLTGLFNRRYFFEMANKEIKRAQRYGRSLSVIMLDIDHFKRFNDTLGHLEGDSALKMVASTLNSHARHADIVARYGGDEFLMLLPETDKEGSRILAERVRKKLSRSYFISDENAYNERNGQITVTIGIGTYPQDALFSDDLIRFTDMALYAGKARGKNCVSLAPLSSISGDLRGVH